MSISCIKSKALYLWNHNVTVLQSFWGAECFLPMFTVSQSRDNTIPAVVRAHSVLLSRSGDLSSPEGLQKSHGSPGPWAGRTSCTCGGGSAEGDVCVPRPARAGAPLWLRVPARAALLGCSRSLSPRRLPHGRAGSTALRAPSCEVGGIRPDQWRSPAALPSELHWRSAGFLLDPGWFLRRFLVFYLPHSKICTQFGVVL